MVFDYSGTDAQTNGFVNGTYTSSASATILTFLQHAGGGYGPPCERPAAKVREEVRNGIISMGIVIPWVWGMSGFTICRKVSSVAEALEV